MITGKRRTREHIIEALSVNHVERFVLREGHTIERFTFDYGYDLTIYTHDKNGEVENGGVYVQLKATDNLRTLQDGKTVALSIAVRDLKFWLGKGEPVALILYVAKGDSAYWVHVQQAFKDTAVDQNAVTVTVRFPKENLWSENAVEYFRQRKQEFLRSGLQGRRR